MDSQTVLVLTIQLLALFSIAGALLLYLLCKVRGQGYPGTRNGQQQGSVLITSADTALGLQLCTHLANKGCRVFAGLKDPKNSLPSKLLRGWMKMKIDSIEKNKETNQQTYTNYGSIVPLKLDVTREDILREATDTIGAHLNAGERGILAVINTAGCAFKGRIENQDSIQWETMFKTNVLGTLRIARSFIGLLKPTRGRLILLGVGNGDDGFVAFTATQQAIDGSAKALCEELRPYGVDVVTLDSQGVPSESLFKAPIPYSMSDVKGTPIQYSAEVLTTSALGVIEKALWDAVPQQRYSLATSNTKLRLPCRTSSFRTMVPEPKELHIIQNV